MRLSHKSVKSECPTRVSRKSVHRSVNQKACQVRASYTSVKQECLTRLSNKRVKPECPTRASVKQDCRTRVSNQCVKSGCPTAVPGSLSLNSVSIRVRGFHLVPFLISNPGLGKTKKNRKPTFSQPLLLYLEFLLGAC